MVMSKTHRNEKTPDAATQMLFDEMRQAIDTTCRERDAATAITRAANLMTTIYEQNTGLSRHHVYRHTDNHGGQVELVYRMRDLSTDYRAALDLNRFELTLTQDGRTVQTHRDQFED